MGALCRGSAIGVVIPSERRSLFVLSRELEGTHWLFQLAGCFLGMALLSRNQTWVQIPALQLSGHVIWSG